MQATKTSRVWLAFVSGFAAGAAAVLWTLRAFGVPVGPELWSLGFRKFFNAYDLLVREYYRPVSADTLLDGAVAGMVQSLGDPFSEYMTPAAARQFHNLLSGSFAGIGVLVKKGPDGAVIVSVNPGSPAEKGGLRAGDVIVRVNGRSLAGMSLDEVSHLITGPTGTPVELTVRRPGNRGRLFRFRIVRAKVEAPTVWFHMLPQRIGYVDISIVGSQTGSEFTRALRSLQKSGASRLILDLRGNPGGYLDQAVKVAGDLIPKGEVILYTQDRAGPKVPVRSPGPGSTLPVVVLVDRNTASAAEVLAAALKDDRGAQIVGTRTYGKGTVQVTQTYPDGSALKYTVSRWLTPAGQWVNKVGLKPTLSVSAAADDTRDPQLEAAERAALRAR
ncbi:MAG: S41 family peptidase [Alicyclobacillus sp.]|nr:S41 family peptidase [Alicyclobacillus sp.]